MNHRKLVIVHDADHDTLSVELHQFGNVQAAPAVPFEDPLTPEDRAELRWYLEDYLSFPVGIYPERARRAEAKLGEWGGRMFDALFGSGRGRDYYVLVRNEGLEKTGFEVRYRQSRVGNVPWELLYDTEDGVFLVHQFASFSRHHHSSTGRLSEPRPAGGELNVLLVIARPYGQRDVPYRTVARPVMELLSRPRLRERIRVEVLRPPTFQRFQEELKRTRGDGRPFFDIVHFDGHGGFGISLEVAARLDVFDAYKGPHGKLLFENADGGEHRVEADELRQWLGRHKVPLIVLNACRSGMEALEDARVQQLVAALAQAQKGADLDVESLRRLLAGQNEEIQSVAGTLLNAGADGVVAMGYVVRARAAAIFIRHFYARLLAGGSAAEAVKAGRMALVEERARPTRFGDQDLQDWLIPVYHERLPVRVFEPPAESEADALFTKLTAGEAETSAPVEEALPAAPFHGFVGREVEPASSYHHMGWLAQERRDFEQAEQWYKKSLEIKLRLGNVHGVAISYHQLGQVARLQRNGPSSARYYLKALRPFQDLDDPHNAQIVLSNLARLHKSDLLDRAMLEELWEGEIGGPLPEDIAEFIFSENRSDYDSEESIPPELRQALAQLQAAGLSANRIVAMLEQATGQKLPPELTQHLRTQLEESETPNDPDSP